MSQWDKLFQQKLKEVLHHKHRDYEYASLSPTANGNVARALIAEEYYAQADRIAELEKCLIVEQEHNMMLEEKQSEPVAWMYACNGVWTAFSDELPPDDAYDKGTLTPLYTTPQTKPLSIAIEIIKDFQNSDVPPCKYYEDTYADGWMDACNEILWAIEAKVRG